MQRTTDDFARQLFDECEKLKEIFLKSTTNSLQHRQQLVDHYEQLILYDLDFALEQKVENDLWTLIFKNEMTIKQDALKKQLQPAKRVEIQTNLQIFYDYAKGFYLKLLQNVVSTYNFPTSICHLTFSFVRRRSTFRSCKEASILYFIQNIFVHVGDLNRYGNQIDLAKIFYENAIETIPFLGQPFNQLAIVYEMKSPQTNFISQRQQLLTTFFYIRSIAIKVTFPSAKANLEKFFNKFKEISSNDDEFLSIFLRITSWIYFEINFDSISSLIERFRLLIVSNFDLEDFIRILTILFYLLHRSTFETSEKSFQIALQVLIVIIDECFQEIQLPLSKMLIDEQKILPIVYLTFAFLSTLQKTKNSLFENRIFYEKTAFWNIFAKLLRSFGVEAKVSESNFFLQHQDFPLSEERKLESFSPFNELFKTYRFKNVDILSEKDERQLRKFRLVTIIRNLCQRQDEKTSKRFFEHLVTFVKDDFISFETPAERQTSQRPAKTPRANRNVVLRQFLDSADELK